MTEELLHFIWRFQKLNKAGLQTTEGKTVEIVKPGFLNEDAGPDFRDARIIIDEQLWAGAVEIHINSSDWYQHGHQDDAAYDVVVLHVVYENDRPVLRQNGEEIPAIELKGRIDEQLFWRYEQLLENQNFIPCEDQINTVEAFVKNAMLERCLIERMEQKTGDLQNILHRNQGNWQKTFYQWVCRSFGLRINAVPMLQLARKVEESWIGRHRQQPLQIEALFLGASGLLPRQSVNEHESKLIHEFRFLSAKYQIDPMQPSIWKYSKLRPPAFPDRRLAQLSAFWTANENLFARILEYNSAKELLKLFDFTMPDYWKDHYRLGQKGKAAPKATPGKDFQNRFVINAVVPFIFLYGSLKGNENLRQKALDTLEELPAEKNKITLGFEHLGMELSSAFHSQAMIHLKKYYCDKKRCLSCQVGSKLLKELKYD